MKKERKALIPIVIAIIATVFIGQASSSEVDKPDCNYAIDIVNGSTTSVEAEIYSEQPRNVTVVWHYKNRRPLQSYFRADTGFDTEFKLLNEAELDYIEARGMNCGNITDRYP